MSALCRGDSGKSIFTEELHWLPDTTKRPLSSAGNDNCCSDGEASISLLLAAAVCTRSKPAHVAAADVLSIDGNCPPLMRIVDGTADERLRSTFTGPESCCRLHSSDKTSANLDDPEWVWRLFFTCSALCRCLTELNVRRYNVSGLLSKRCLTLAAATELDNGANVGFNDKHNQSN